ncbi:hypothetical protein H6P81_013943 [Aristolochia fimbriata]|uniref:Ribosomal protein L2 n=1 Tax=Aristolochia fimbriata TaxID=158543 RepID=A0AAV7EG37_ARIFI|nr:hypothetical protein H6P81_013943 [Aristolochia fimbriata]
MQIPFPRLYLRSSFSGACFPFQAALSAGLPLPLRNKFSSSNRINSSPGRSRILLFRRPNGSCYRSNVRVFAGLRVCLLNRRVRFGRYTLGHGEAGKGQRARSPREIYGLYTIARDDNLKSPAACLLPPACYLIISPKSQIPNPKSQIPNSPKGQTPPPYALSVSRGACALRPILSLSLSLSSNKGGDSDVRVTPNARIGVMFGPGRLKRGGAMMMILCVVAIDVENGD